VVNRVWNLWCSLAGTDPDDAQQKLAFNLDPRVASLSGHSVELVEALALELWGREPGRPQDDFLDLWLAEVAETQCRLDVEIEGQRRQRAEALERRRRAEEEVRRRRAAEEERRRRAEEEECRRRYEEAEGRRRAEEARQLQWERQRVAQARLRIRHLYNITSVLNLESIARRGILCHDLAASVDHEDLSDRGIQDRRDGFHQLASLYFNPLNAMLYRLHKWEHREVVVLRVSAEVLDLPGVVITDGNAAASASECWHGPHGLAHIDLDRVYSTTWSIDGVSDREMRRITQAEVLVPQVIPPRFIESFLAPSSAICERAQRAAPDWPGEVDQTLFFDA
jgi:hypothetical protein